MTAATAAASARRQSDRYLFIATLMNLSIFDPPSVTCSPTFTNSSLPGVKLTSERVPDVEQRQTFGGEIACERVPQIIQSAASCDPGQSLCDVVVLAKG